MNKAKTMVAKIAKVAAESSLKRDANRTTCGAIYQPKAPAGLARFKKGEK